MPTITRKRLPSTAADWRCHSSDRLLGRRRGGCIHIQIQRDGNYLVKPPVSAICPSCGELNKAT